MNNPLNLSLYLVLDPEHCTHHHPLEVLTQALEAGVSIVQFRQKNIPRDSAKPLAQSCRELCSLHNVPFIVNDDPLLALDVGADGFHLGQNDTLPPSLLPQLTLSKTIIGRTARSHDELLSLRPQVLNNLCHYIGIGAVFASSSKQHPDSQFLGIQGLKTFLPYAQSLLSPSFPLCAISGISHHNVQDVLSTGINGIAVISAICSAENPYQATRQLRQIIHNHQRNVS